MNYFEQKKILVPYDFSDRSSKAVETAIQITGDCKHVTVLHVIEPLPSYDIDGGYNVEIDDDRVDQALKNLTSRFKAEQYQGLSFETVHGDPPHGIADFCQGKHFDLIVMPSHGRTGLKRLFIGSVAERVVRLAHCPVLVLRE